jgi:hypothetical protein
LFSIARSILFSSIRKTFAFTVNQPSWWPMPFSTARHAAKSLDAFLGNGMTPIAAERSGRFCYGIELNPRNVDTIIRRWQAFTGQSAMRASTSRTFHDFEEQKYERSK